MRPCLPTPPSSGRVSFADRVRCVLAAQVRLPRPGAALDRVQRVGAGGVPLAVRVRRRHQGQELARPRPLGGAATVAAFPSIESIRSQWDQLLSYRFVACEEERSDRGEEARAPQSGGSRAGSDRLDRVLAWVCASSARWLVDADKDATYRRCAARNITARHPLWPPGRSFLCRLAGPTVALLLFFLSPTLATLQPHSSCSPARSRPLDRSLAQRLFRS